MVTSTPRHLDLLEESLLKGLKADFHRAQPQLTRCLVHQALHQIGSFRPPGAAIVLVCINDFRHGELLRVCVGEKCAQASAEVGDVMSTQDNQGY